MDKCGHFSNERFFAFEDEFVVDLHQHADFGGVVADLFMETDHRELDEVGRAALDDGVEGGALAELTAGLDRGFDVGDRAAATENRCDIPLRAGLYDAFVGEAFDGGEAAAVGGDVGVGLVLWNLQNLGEAEAGLAVDDAEVDGFGDGAHFGRHLLFRNAVQFGGDEAVDVAVGGEGFDEGLFTAIVSEHAQFDLRVIGGDQDVFRLGDERPANFASDVGFDWNVLQVGIGGGEAAGLGDGLIEVCMDAAGFFRG